MKKIIAGGSSNATGLQVAGAFRPDFGARSAATFERLATADELPSLKEIELLMKLERQLEVAEMVEQANALTREPHA